MSDSNFDSTVAWATDIHLDHASTHQISKFCASIPLSKYLILTGDISTAGSVARHVADVARRTGTHVLYVLGNHDHWEGHVDSTREQARRSTGSTYLHGAEPVQLTDDCSVVGSDGFYDGVGAGTLHQVPFLMNDWFEIADLEPTGMCIRNSNTESWPALLFLIKRLAEESASALERSLSLVRTTRAIVAVHVPPWPTCSRYMGQPGPSNGMPFYSSVTMAAAIERALANHELLEEVLVLCGHTHERWTADIGPGIRCAVGAAEYGIPEVQDLDVTTFVRGGFAGLDASGWVDRSTSL